jgi:hypothetical protein
VFVSEIADKPNNKENEPRPICDVGIERDHVSVIVAFWLTGALVSLGRRRPGHDVASILEKKEAGSQRELLPIRRDMTVSGLSGSFLSWYAREHASVLFRRAEAAE